MKGKRIIQTKKAPAAIGPYSQAVEINETLYISGQLGINPETGSFVEGGISEQTRQIMKNTEAILLEAGYRFSDVIKTTCLLSDMNDFSGMNEIYSNFYPNNPPARSSFAVKELPLGALIEIETIAVR